MHLLSCIALLSLLVITSCKKGGDKPDWAKKSIIDYTDADLERLLDQWDEDEEPIPVDELPYGHPDRPQAPMDFSKLDMNNPGDVMKATKKGKTVMMFVKVNHFKEREETEQVTSLWEMGLYNNHVQAERTLMEDHTVMFLFRDGADAWEAKDYLVEQERVEEVQLEGKTYKGNFAEEKDDEGKKKIKKEKTKKNKKGKKGTNTKNKVEL